MKCLIYFLLLLPLTAKSVTSDNFDFNSYFRSGAGFNHLGTNKIILNNVMWQGNQQRLGNENTYGELKFAAKTYKGKKANDQAWDARFMLAYEADGLDTAEANQMMVREAYAQGHNILGTKMSIWAGKRLYRDVDQHINDFYYFADMSGYGTGIENINLPFGNLAISYIQQTSGTATDTSKGDLKVSALDARLFAIPVTKESNLNLWGVYGFSEGGNIAGVDVEDSKGAILGARYNIGTKNFNNNIAIVYGTGTLRNINMRVDLTQQNQSGNRFRFVEDFLASFSPNLDIYFALNYEKASSGNMWSVATRPIYFLNDELSFAFETGYQGNSKGETMTRVTFAPQFTPPIKGVWTRPVIRLFSTYSKWSGYNPNAATIAPDRKHIYQYGFQVEGWF